MKPEIQPTAGIARGGKSRGRDLPALQQIPAITNCRAGRSREAGFPAVCCAGGIYAVGFLAAALAIIAGGGCAVVHIKTPQWQAAGASLFKDINLRPIRLGPDGSVDSQGYRSGVDGEALGEAAGAAAKVMVQP